MQGFPAAVHFLTWQLFAVFLELQLGKVLYERPGMFISQDRHQDLILVQTPTGHGVATLTTVCRSVYGLHQNYSICLPICCYG